MGGSLPFRFRAQNWKKQTPRDWLKLAENGWRAFERADGRSGRLTKPSHTDREGGRGRALLPTTD